MKTKKNINYIVIFFLSITIFLGACQKSLEDFFNEQFPETTNSSDEIIIDGQVAVPLLNTYFTLSNIIPTLTDSSLWLELDPNNLIHFRMYYKDVFSLNPNDIFPTSTFPGPLSKDSITFNTDSNKLSMFNNMLDGHLFFNNPKLTLIFYNQMPLNLFMRLDSLNFISSLGIEKMGQTSKHYILKGGISGAGSISETKIVFDKNSEGLSNFPDIFTPIPSNFNIKITTGLDKDTNYSGDGSEKLKMDIDLDLPAEISLLDLLMTDTIPFKIDSADSPIEGLTLKIFFDNEFPFSGKTQLFFVDTNATGQANNIIVKLFDADGWEFASGVTNAAGETISTTKSDVTIALTKAQLDSLKQFNASKIIIQSTLNTYNSSSSQNAKIFSFYKLGIKIGAKIDYSLNILQ